MVKRLPPIEADRLFDTLERRGVLEVPEVRGLWGGIAALVRALGLTVKGATSVAFFLVVANLAWIALEVRRDLTRPDEGVRPACERLGNMRPDWCPPAERDT